jgi:hypothetical protein
MGSRKPIANLDKESLEQTTQVLIHFEFSLFCTGIKISQIKGAGICQRWPMVYEILERVFGSSDPLD